MASDYLDHPPRSFLQVACDRMLATLDAHAADEFVRVIWLDERWALLTVAEMIADLRADAVVDADKIDRLEFLPPGH